MRKLTEGWQINGIAAFQSGNPFTIFSNDNQSQQASGLDRADLVGKPQTFQRCAPFRLSVLTRTESTEVA